MASEGGEQQETWGLWGRMGPAASNALTRPTVGEMKRYGGVWQDEGHPGSSRALSGRFREKGNLSKRKQKCRPVSSWGLAVNEKTRMRRCPNGRVGGGRA